MLVNAVLKGNAADMAKGGSVKVSLSWKGSWKNEINCDGVYLFVKYKTKGEYGYHTAKLAGASGMEFDYSDLTPESVKITGASSPAGAYVPEEKLGVFVYPLDKQEKCDMKIDDLSMGVDMPADVEDVQVFALEMVYVPQDKHYVGDPGNGISKGGSLKNCLYTYPDKGAYLIESEDAIEFAPEDGHLYCDLDTPNGRQEDDRFVIPAEFPKGYKAMWYMKYSLTEGQFVQFLNCLTRKQQQTHCMADLSTEDIPNYYAVTDTIEPRDRCEVYCSRFGNALPAPVKFYTAAPNRAMNAISFADTSAFACFAGLRPMTELEYEKACRGPLPAVKEEFAWGSTKIGRVFHFDGVDGSGSEKPVPQKPGEITNCNFGTDIAPFEKEFKTVPDNPGWIGPVTVGLFENSAPNPELTERERTGASYYGIMELCGNVWENIVTLGREDGRRYIPKHGSGELTEDGYHNMDCWPDPKTATGAGVRGGVFVSPNPTYLHVALRVFGSHTKNDKRYHGGIRVGY